LNKQKNRLVESEGLMKEFVCVMKTINWI